MAVAKKKSKSSKTSEGLPNFEQTVQRLGTIVEQLESGDLPLEESLQLFEEGVKLSRASQAVLDTAEQRVEKLLNLDDSGEPVLVEMSDSETDPNGAAS